MNGMAALLGFHALFGVVAVLALGFAPAGFYGIAITALVVGYHVALVGWSAWRRQREWLVLWGFLLPLSLLQVVPDWILVEQIGSLQFFDHGVPRIGAVPVYMAGMWMIPLFVIVRCADAMPRGGMRPLAALIAALVVFGAAELLAAPLGLWAMRGVDEAFMGAALYVLPAEALLGLAAWWGHRLMRGRAWPLRALVAAGISVLYTGALITGYFFIETGATP